MRILKQKSRKNNPGRHGVTLIELTITVLLIGIIAAVATPRILSTFNHFRLESATEQIVADIKLVRHQAKIKGATQKITFNVATNSYGTPGLRDRNHPNKDYAVDLDDLPGDISLYSVDFASAGNLTFNMYGQPTDGGTVKLKSGNLLKTITVEDSVGKVTVQ